MLPKRPVASVKHLYEDEGDNSIELTRSRERSVGWILADLCLDSKVCKPDKKYWNITLKKKHIFNSEKVPSVHIGPSKILLNF